MGKIFAFPYVVDRVVYFGPAFGIFMLSFIGTGFCMFPVAALLAGVPWLSGDIVGAMGLVVCIAGGALGATMWVRHWMRVHSERKVVIDQSGIAVHHFANEVVHFPWDKITSIEEVEVEDEEGSSYALFFTGGGKKERIHQFDYVGYADIKSICAARLPDRTKTIATPAPSPGAEVIRSWS